MAAIAHHHHLASYSLSPHLVNACLQESGTAELEVLRSELASTVRKAMNAVVSGEAAEERAKAAEQARAQVWVGGQGGQVGGGG